MSLQRFLKTVVSGLRTDRRRKQASGVSRMEWLESRALLAGNVLVTLQDGLARITGDNNDNAVEVVASGSSVVVRGLNGTTINSGASAFTLATSSTTFPGSLVAMLGAGNDSISVRSGVTISGTTRLNGEAGNDALAVSGTLTGRVALNAGAGTDSIAVLNVTAPGGLRLDSSGTAVIAISGSTIGSALDISTGNGSDEIVVTGTTVNGHTSIVTRNGNDDIVLKNSTLRGRFYLSADRGDDVAIIDSTTIERESHLWMREGEDAVQVQGTSVLSSKFFVGQLLGQNATEIKLPATVSRLRQVGRPSNNVSDSLVEERITSPTTGAIARTDAVLAAATPTLTMVIAAASIAENGGAAATTAVITRSGSTNADLIVNLSSSNEARAKFASATATIPSGQTSVTVNVSAVDNTTAESEATVTLTAAATGFISGTDTVVVTSDEIAALTVTAAQSTFAENAAEAARTFTVSRNTTDKSTAVTVNLASNTTSRLTVPASVTIPANASSVTFVATTVNNTTVDANVDVVITASAAGLASGTVTVTVTDDDSPALSLSATPSAVLENAGTGAVTLTVSRSATDNTASLVVNLSSGSSRLTVPASVIIPAGQASTTFTATPTNDSVFSGQTSVVVTATAAGLTTGTGTVIINDDESAALSLTSSVTTVSESAASPAVTYTVSRNTADTTSAVVVTLTSSDTARLTVPGTVTIPAGQSSVTFVGTPVNNTAADGSQLVTVTASLTGFSTAQASVTVTDDDGANLSLSANPVSVAENAGDNTITFTVTRNAGPITNALTVNLTSGTAGRLTVPPTVTIPAGAASVTVAGTPVNNSNDDGDAVVLITAAATGLAAATTNVTVTDDDIPSLTITASPAGVAENAGSNAVTYTVSRNTSDNSAALVVSLSDGGSSRLDIPSTVTIPAGAASVTVQATPVNNTLDDGDVSVTVTATATGFAPDDVAVSITDDDAAALTLTVSPESAAESAGSGAVTFTLSRNSGDVSQALTVNLSSANTSRLTVPATATIPAGQASVTFAGTAVDDSIVNASLTVLVTASATGFVNGTGTVTLTDNDAAAFSLTATPLSLSESDTSPVKFTLQRTGADLSQAVTVQLLSGSTSRFAVPASVTISAGFNQVSFDGNVVNNTAADGNASVSISASAAGYATGQTSVTVNDDEASGPTLALSLSKSALPENAGSDASVLTVTRSNASTASALVVTLTSSNTTRISVPASVTIPAGQTSATAAIATIDNTAIDGSPTIVMTASATGFANQQTSLIVVDNENAVLSLAFPQTTVPEDAGTLAGTVTSSITSSSDLVVSLAYSDPTVISGPSTVTIPAGQTSTPVTLTVVNGGVLTGSAKAKVAAAAVGAALDVEEITVNDVDDVSITTNISSNTFVQSNGTVITRNSSFVITGTTVPNANITVDSDGDGAYDDASLTADSSGAYSLNVTLTNTNANRGENQIRIRSANGPEFGDTAVNAHLAVGTVVRFATNAGNYDVELLDTAAPGTVANFLAYMNSPKYDNLIVHRSVSDFVVQAGGFTVNNGQITPVTPNAAITNEFKAENSNLRGTLSMAQQAGQPNSGTSQWFVNVANNSFLDNAQHTVFGRVIGTGMSVVDAINDIPVRNINTLYGQTALAEVPLRNPAPAGTQISGTVTTISGSAVITGVGTQFTSQLSAGDSIKIGGTLFFVQSIQSDTSLTLKSSVSFGATLLTVLRDVVPEDADFVVFSDISKILDVI